jgi:hypothetical protein
LRHALFIQLYKFLLVVNLHDLHRPRVRVGNVELGWVGERWGRKGGEKYKSSVPVVGVGRVEWELADVEKVVHVNKGNTPNTNLHWIKEGGE